MKYFQIRTIVVLIIGMLITNLYTGVGAPPKVSTPVVEYDDVRDLTSVGTPGFCIMLADRSAYLARFQYSGRIPKMPDHITIGLLAKDINFAEKIYARYGDQRITFPVTFSNQESASFEVPTAIFLEMTTADPILLAVGDIKMGISGEYLAPLIALAKTLKDTDHDSEIKNGTDKGGNSDQIQENDKARTSFEQAKKAFETILNYCTTEQCQALDELLHKRLEQLQSHTKKE